MAEHESAHEHGDMDSTEQDKTFDGLVRWSINVALISIGIVVFLAIFAT